MNDNFFSIDKIMIDIIANDPMIGGSAGKNGNPQKEAIPVAQQTINNSNLFYQPPLNFNQYGVNYGVNSAEVNNATVNEGVMDFDYAEAMLFSPKEAIDLDQTQKIKKGSWSIEEDEKLVGIISEYKDNPHNFNNNIWNEIAEKMETRTAYQIKMHWLRCRAPEINKGQWTDEEDKIIIEHVKKWGRKWTKISKKLSRRIPIQVKGRYRTLERRSSAATQVFNNSNNPKIPSHQAQAQGMSVHIDPNQFSLQGNLSEAQYLQQLCYQIQQIRSDNS